MVGYCPHIWMSCFSVSKLCERLYWSSAGTKSYPGLRTVHPLSSKGHLFPSLCTQAPRSDLCKCSHFPGRRTSCAGAGLHGFDSIPQCSFLEYCRWPVESSHLAHVAREERAGCCKWRDSRLQWLQDLLKGVWHWKFLGKFSGYRKRPSLSQIRGWILCYLRDWILLIIGKTQNKEKFVDFFLNHHIPHLKTKLKITSPIWKCLSISHSKLIYSKINLSICNTLGETLGNLPSISIQQIWLISFPFSRPQIFACWFGFFPSLYEVG